MVGFVGFCSLPKAVVARRLMSNLVRPASRHDRSEFRYNHNLLSEISAVLSLTLTDHRSSVKTSDFKERASVTTYHERGSQPAPQPPPPSSCGRRCTHTLMRVLPSAVARVTCHMMHGGVLLVRVSCRRQPPLLLLLLLLINVVLLLLLLSTSSSSSSSPSPHFLLPVVAVVLCPASLAFPFIATRPPRPSSSLPPPARCSSVR